MASAQKILVVEDEPDIRKLVQYNLTQERFNVLEAEDGEQALKLLQREKPNLVILDLMLPGLSGHGALQASEAAQRDRQAADPHVDGEGR